MAHSDTASLATSARRAVYELACGWLLGEPTASFAARVSRFEPEVQDLVRRRTAADLALAAVLAKQPLPEAFRVSLTDPADLEESACAWAHGLLSGRAGQPVPDIALDVDWILLADYLGRAAPMALPTLAERLPPALAARAADVLRGLALALLGDDPIQAARLGRWAALACSSELHRRWVRAALTSVLARRNQPEATFHALVAARAWEARA